MSNRSFIEGEKSTISICSRWWAQSS